MSDLDKLLKNFKNIAESGTVSHTPAAFTTYAISNFRGGIGKSTLAFNLAWEVSRTKKTLLFDLCPQSNFSQSLLGDELEPEHATIYDALLPHVMPGTTVVSEDDLLVSVPPCCAAFKRGAGVHLVPGSKDLFLFPSLLYSQLSQATTLGSRSKDTTRNILQSVENLSATMRKHLGAAKVLIDTSPFFGGATHLGWVAADALVIPVRVDQHSMEALKLTLQMLTNVDMDFLRLNQQAGIKKRPKVHSIVMTHCGWNRQMAYTPDRSTQAYLAQVIEIVKQHTVVFDGDPIDSVHLLDDFHSAGRISGSKRIPLAKLNVGESYTIEGQRLEVNESLTRYQRELKALASSI